MNERGWSVRQPVKLLHPAREVTGTVREWERPKAEVFRKRRLRTECCIVSRQLSVVSRLRAASARHGGQLSCAGFMHVRKSLERLHANVEAV